jgi:hypothetical protein
MSKKKLLDHFPEEIQTSIIEEVLSGLSTEQLKKALEGKENNLSDKDMEADVKAWAESKKLKV